MAIVLFGDGQKRNVMNKIDSQRILKMNSIAVWMSFEGGSGLVETHQILEAKQCWS